MARRRFQEGFVFKRGKRRKIWVGRWREMEIGADGKLGFVRRSEVLGPVAELTKTDAKQKLREKFEAKQKTGAIDTAVTFKDFIDRWWKPAILPSYKPSTKQQAQLALDNYLVPKFGDCKLSEISRADVQAFFGSLVEKLSPDTVHGLHRFLRRMLGCAVEWRFLLENAASKIKLPRTKTRAAVHHTHPIPKLAHGAARPSPDHGPAGDDDFNANWRDSRIAMGESGSPTRNSSGVRKLLPRPFFDGKNSKFRTADSDESHRSGCFKQVARTPSRRSGRFDLRNPEQKTAAGRQSVKADHLSRLRPAADSEVELAHVPSSSRNAAISARRSCRRDAGAARSRRSENHVVDLYACASRRPTGDAVSRLERFLLDPNGPKLHQKRAAGQMRIGRKLLAGLEKA